MCRHPDAVWATGLESTFKRRETYGGDKFSRMLWAHAKYVDIFP